MANFYSDPDPAKEATDGIGFNRNSTAKLVSAIKTEKASGSGEMPNHALNACEDAITFYLEIVFTKFLEHGVVPDEWRLANVLPIHQPRLLNKVEKYRRISLFIQCLKLLEHI